MHYIVEVAIDAGNLARELSQMRTWLDHMKFEAISFKQIPGANIYRVDFEGEQEARAFAQAFACQVLNRTAVHPASISARIFHDWGNVDSLCG